MESDDKTNHLISRFSELCMPFGWSDVRACMKIAEEVKLNADEVFEIIDEQSEELGMKFADMDICYALLEHILQMARNKIDEVLGYDFINDNEGSIYTHSNYMCSCYDYNDSDKADLQKQFSKATEHQKEKLKDDDFVSYVLSEMEI